MIKDEMKIKEFEKKFPEPTIAKSKFKNEYGEEFTLYNSGISVMFGGDETNQEVIPLFNQHFNIFSIDELELIAKAILETTEKLKLVNKP